MEMHRAAERESGFTITMRTLDEPLEPMRDLISIDDDLRKFSSAGRTMEF